MNTLEPKLTETQEKILRLVTQGNDNKEIAQKLFISHHTVKAHMSLILKKLHATNRAQAVYLASKSNLID